LLLEKDMRQQSIGRHDESEAQPTKAISEVTRRDIRDRLILLASQARARARGQKRKPAAFGGLPPRCQKWNSV
jgi:hypothetical protein